jgi:hypothetical protein
MMSIRRIDERGKNTLKIAGIAVLALVGLAVGFEIVRGCFLIWQQTA